MAGLCETERLSGDALEEMVWSIGLCETGRCYLVRGWLGQLVSVRPTVIVEMVWGRWFGRLVSVRPTVIEEMGWSAGLCETDRY